MVKKKTKFIKIFWQDAVIYKNHQKQFSLAKKMTLGKLMNENSNFVIIKNPITSIYVKKEKMYLPISDSRQPSFFYIPTGMISKMDRLEI